MKQTRIDVIEHPDDKPANYPRDTFWLAVKVDGKRVPGFKVTIRKDEDGFPSMVYINGGHPFYPTWVYRDNAFLLAYSPGLVSGSL